jgi:hypothetical protein
VNVIEYYDDVPDAASATIISVTAPNPVNEIDAQLRLPAPLDKKVYMPIVVR